MINVSYLKKLGSAVILMAGLIGAFSPLTTGCQKKNDSGENIDVEGWVTNDSDKMAIPGASILVKGIERGTTTDSEGYFKITAPDSAELVVSFVGFESQVRPVKGVQKQIIALKKSPISELEDTGK